MELIFLLIAILSVIVSLTFWLNSRQKKVAKTLLKKQEPRFDIDQQSNQITEKDNDLHETSYQEQNEHLLFEDPLLTARKPQSTSSANQPAQKIKSVVEEIMYFMLIAKHNKPYIGYELLQALLTAGLRFGAMNIFHHYDSPQGKGKILFSVASAQEPGTFEINKIGAYSCKGLMIFMRLSNHKDLLMAFDLMLETAKQLIEDLNGDILDDERKVLTPEKIQAMKNKIIDFEKKQVMGDLFDQ